MASKLRINLGTFNLVKGIGMLCFIFAHMTSRYSVENVPESNELKADEITEEKLSSALYTTNIPDPDMLIRTGGEKRISNYLLWQVAYAELLFVDEYWPDFGKKELALAIEEFNRRNRRFGK